MERNGSIEAPCQHPRCVCSGRGTSIQHVAGWKTYCVSTAHQRGRDDFLRKYGDTRGIISKRKKAARLVMITTTSSLGRSSVYNRLKLGDQMYLEPIGYTQGWGHFHVPNSLFAELRNYLRKKKHKYVDGHKFGKGPNWRLRTIRAAFDALDFRADLLRHEIGREVFVCDLASNARSILKGEATRPMYGELLSVDEVGRLARERWMIGRAATRPEFREWRRDQFAVLVTIPRDRISVSHSATPNPRKTSRRTMGNIKRSPIPLTGARMPPR